MFFLVRIKKNECFILDSFNERKDAIDHLFSLINENKNHLHITMPENKTGYFQIYKKQYGYIYDYKKAECIYQIIKHNINNNKKRITK